VSREGLDGKAEGSARYELQIANCKIRSWELGIQRLTVRTFGSSRVLRETPEPVEAHGNVLGNGNPPDRYSPAVVGKTLSVRGGTI
jgi:hypothetical protein